MSDQPTSASQEPNGPAWAALLAASIGGAAFGLLTMASEISPGRAGAALKWYSPAGSLSGVGILAVIIWLIVWAALHFRWKTRNVASEKKIMAAIFLLVVAALLATFPPFYELFVKNG